MLSACSSSSLFPLATPYKPLSDKIKVCNYLSTLILQSNTGADSSNTAQTAPKEAAVAIPTR